MFNKKKFIINTGGRFLAKAVCVLIIQHDSFKFKIPLKMEQFHVYIPNNIKYFTMCWLLCNTTSITHITNIFNCLYKEHSFCWSYKILHTHIYTWVWLGFCFNTMSLLNNFQWSFLQIFHLIFWIITQYQLFLNAKSSVTHFFSQ